MSSLFTWFLIAVLFLAPALGLLGVASVIAPLTWERYLARFVGLLVLVAVWQLGPRTKLFFLGLALCIGRLYKDAWDRIERRPKAKG